MADAIKTRFALFLHFDNPDAPVSDYGPRFEITASVVTVGPTERDRDVPRDGIRNPDYSIWRNDPGLYLTDLECCGWGYAPGRIGRQNGEPRSLVWDNAISYKGPYRVMLGTAERMVRTLKTIGARMDRSAAKYGSPATFGAFLAHYAQAVGAEQMVIRDESDRHGSLNYSEMALRFFSIRNGAAHADYIAGKWIAAGAPVATEAQS